MERTLFDVLVEAVIDGALENDSVVKAAEDAFFAEVEQLSPGGDARDAGVLYATALAEAAFKLGWELRADPDRLRTLEKPHWSA
jgi:hypothetical protein